jgi:hypothetical protein
MSQNSLSVHPPFLATGVKRIRLDLLYSNNDIRFARAQA